ncbi:MAG: nuclear transport factor 2 family protein [Candidatus Zixiibacteriota bacterium]
MKTLALAAIGFLVLVGCAAQNDIVKETQSLMQTDRDFSAVSESLGMYAAFEQYMADSATVLTDGSHPLTGHDEIMKMHSPTDSARLTWEPIFARIAESADLGYTIGHYDYSTMDSAGNDINMEGYYVTIWERQPDGSWKYVFDTGTQGVPPQQ